MVVLIPLEVKQHTVPHLKALTSGLEPQVGMGMTALLHITTLSYLPILLYKQAKWQFNVKIAVSRLKD